MAPDDEDEEDLYDDEFDFVDDDDEDDDSDTDESDTEDSDLGDSDIGDDDDDSKLDAVDAPADSELDDAPAPRPLAARRPPRPTHNDDVAIEPDRDGQRDDAPLGDEEPADEFARPEPAANFRVHIYEYRQFKRTIDRPFTPEDAEAFASEYNRTSKSYGRFAVAGKEDAKPKKALD